MLCLQLAGKRFDIIYDIGDNMKYARFSMILISGLIIVIGIAGCFKEIVETREPLPELVWPDPPETARIHFVNSISTPEHLNIRASL
jgi:hypothetical protein